MVHVLVVSLLLAQAGTPAPAAAPATPTGADNLWLVAPLYPGQEILVGRTEKAIHDLLPQGSVDLVGLAALQSLATQHKGDLGCALGETVCASPMDQYLRGLGLAKLVLIKGGQEEPNYRFDVTSIDLTTGEQRNASGQGPVLEKALLAALVKVAPLASVLKVSSTPPGLDLYVDNEKIGKTPYEGQILPGERTVKITGQGYQDLVKTITVPARGNVTVDEKLSLLPSTLIIKPLQKAAAIYVDGKAVGAGDVTTPVEPGTHTITAKLEGYQDYNKSITVPPNGQATDVPDLSPTTESGIMKRTMYVEVGFAQEMLRKRSGTYKVNAKPLNTVDTSLGPNGAITNPPIGALNGGNTGRGFTIDWGQQREHFGLLLLGFSYLPSNGDATRAYANSKNGAFNDPNLYAVPATYGDMFDLHFVQPQVNFVVWHIMGYVQAGLGVRSLKINTPSFEDDVPELGIHGVKHSDGYLDVAPYGEVKVGLRGYLIEGAYITVDYHLKYVEAVNGPDGFETLSSQDGFEAGFGYAF